MDEIPPEVPGYRLTRLLGTGSTSTVWRARRETDDELVAIKLLHGGADDEALREYSMLQHAAAEHVVTLHEVREVDTDEGPATALVLELLAGGSLGRVVAERGHLTPGETVTVIAPIARALAGLHGLGVVHGDLSPGNVLLDSTGRPVLADLGFSRLTGEAPGDVHGTDGYVAPEVLDGEEPSRASDVHALGALAWLCLVGEPPGHVADRVDLRAGLADHPALVDVVESCLAGDPASRPEADEVAVDVFDAAPAQPLRMTTTGDVASGLTRRIREAAARDGVQVPDWQRELVADEAPSLTRRWWQRRRNEEQTASEGPRARAGRHAAPRHARDEDIDLTRDADVSATRDIARAAEQGPSSRRLAVAVTVALGLALAVVVPWRQLASADDEGSAPRPASVVATDEPATTGSADAADSTGVLTDRSAPRSAPVRLAQALTTMRQQVVTDLDPVVLGRLDEQGSPAATRDRELLEELRAGGLRYEGLSMTVRSASLERTGGSTTVLRTVVDEGAYSVVGRDGSRQQRPARRAQRADLVLAWDGQRWRVRDVTASDAG